MLSIRKWLIHFSALIALGLICSSQAHAQAALLLEEPYGFFGMVNPTGHVAVYFQRICADTPVKLRRCHAGEQGAVIARYQGIDGYDWVAIPLVPYLYAVENTSQVPALVDHDMVVRLRDNYREAHLETLGEKLPRGNLIRGGWTQLLGAAYERRIYAFRFDTSAQEDDALIARLNDGRNQSKFNLLFSNCADFSRVLLNNYFPRTFRRSIFPDAGMTTPKQITYKLVRYARKHPGQQVTVLEIPQIPGYRRESHSPKGIDESFVTTVYAVPLAIVNPYLAGGLFVDYLVRGRYHLIPKHPQVVGPENLSLLTAPAALADNLADTKASANESALAGSEAQRPASQSSSAVVTQAAAGANAEADSGLKGAGADDE